MNELIPDSRCQGATSKGQCPNPAQLGSIYCQKHTVGTPALSATRRFYHLNRPEVQARVAALASDSRLLSLREGIALMHTMIEERFNLINEDVEKIAGYPQITSMMLALERLVRSTLELELKLDSLLSKEALAEFARSIVEIISRNLEGVPNYESICDSIMDEILETVSTVSNNDRSPTKKRAGRPRQDGVIDVE